MELILLRRSVPEIAAELGIHKRTVQAQLQKAREQWRHDRNDMLDRYYDEDLQKLEMLERAVIEKAIDPKHRDQLWALDRMISIIQRRAEMLGYDAPKRNVNFDLDLASLTNEQLERIAGGEDPITVIQSVTAPQLPSPG